MTVGHTPRVISTVCSVFIRRGGIIVCVVNGARQYSSDLPQGGLEVPCILTFRASEEKECKKAKKLIELALSVKTKAIVLEDQKAMLPARNIQKILSQWPRMGQKHVQLQVILSQHKSNES